MLNSQVSVVAIQQRTALLSVTEALRVAKAIPNHQSSFCWIFLLLLTLSIIRSSCPPSHRWASLGFHFAGFESYLTGRSFRVAWGGEVSKHINWSLGFLRDRFLDPSSSPHTLHHWTHHTGTWLLLPLLRR